MPARTDSNPRVQRSRVWYVTAVVALSAALLLVAVRKGASQAQHRGGALARSGEPDAPAGRGDGAALDFGPTTAATAATAMEAPEAAVVRNIVREGKATPKVTTVVGFAVFDAGHLQPLNAWRASVSLGLQRGDERWYGRRLEGGQQLIDAALALGHGRPDSRSGSDRFVYFEVDPLAPRVVPLSFVVELELNAKFNPRAESELDRPVAQHCGTYRGEGTVTLTGAAFQGLPDVTCGQIGVWAAGVVVAGPHVELGGARVELYEQATVFVDKTPSPQGEAVVGRARTADAAVVSAPILADGSFSVPGPSRPMLPCMHLSVVLADGRAYPQITCVALRSGLVLHVETNRTAQGRLLFRGASATGLARVFAEQGGAEVGNASLERDGTFTLAVPYGTFDVVVESARPSGEIARFPLASLTGATDASTLDLGAIDVAEHAAVMELELVDRSGAPSAASLRWRGPRGSGSAALKAAEVHTLLLPPVVQYDMELVPLPPAKPIALAAKAGRVRIVFGDRAGQGSAASESSK